ncbi:sulfatase family protein [Tautonia plasticadhaerens]|uniref:Arylsulfatase n=1 Tax=Tautonia plasticadhaerens TaxID=2527974 RepID=A0A518H5V9_9BACT|nr:sulfatase-like hydrolase/transferase [Tautonia plasticadhaerens]QDV36224.1 Arylsulfatase [Tautonia plasticadhaerens]
MIPRLMRYRAGASPLAIAALLVVAGAATASDQRPNIVLLVGDDHGWDETGYNGHPHLRTPVLDEMAATGLRFDRFYAAHPSCSPTRGSVITGRHPVRYGTFAPGWSIRPEEVGIARILGEAGYECGHFGKWHLGPVKAESPTNPGAMGFDAWVSHDNFFEMDPALSRDGGPPEVYPGEGSAVVVEQAIRFIGEARRRDKPFFAMGCFGSPHEPYSGLERDLALYDDLPEAYGERSFRLTSNETGDPTTRPLDEVLRERYAEITAMDRAIGQLRLWLDEEGLRGDTLLWYVSDNGSPADGAVTSPLRGHKGQMYEGGLRVPSILEWPERITEPRASDVNAVTSDLLPTLCDLLGLTHPDRPIDGVSLRPLIDGEVATRPRPIGFWEFQVSPPPDRRAEPYIDPGLQEGTTPLVKRMGGLITRDFRNVRIDEVTEQDFDGPRAFLDNHYKLVVHERRGVEPARELFDLRDDPAEEHNLIDEEPEIAEELGQQLRDWQASVLRSLTGADYR